MRARRGLGCLGLLLLLSGCSVVRNITPVDLKPTEVVGVWRGDGRLHNNTGGVPSIEFTADGDFYADDLGYLDAELDPKWDAKRASGQWELKTPIGGHGDAHSMVSLFLDVADGKPDNYGYDGLDAQRVSDGIELIAYVGDPDQGDVVRYRRCADCAALAPTRPPLGTPAAPDPAQLVGAWQDQHGETLTLNAAGTYVATDLRPFDLAVYLLPDNGPVSAAGTWSVAPPAHDPQGAATNVVIVIDTLGGNKSFGNRRLRILDDDTQLILSTVSSDPSIREPAVFHRAPA